METYSWVAADLIRRGPVLDALIAVAAPVGLLLRANGLPVPPPVPVPALIDTGAGHSAISGTIARHLGLLPVGEALISMPDREPRAVRTVRYAVQIVLPALNTVFDVTVIEAQFDESIGAVLGRDILASAIFLYVGATGHCTISFP